MSTKPNNKNIVICLDGTNNQFGKDNTNIIKLYRMLERNPQEQITYYDPGVGTMGDPLYKSGLAKTITQILGSAFGQGMMENVMQAYEFLMDQYEDGDSVFIFGFSRGAYTARVLAAFIKQCGLFERGATNLFPYAEKLFLEPVPEDENEKTEYYKLRSSFRSTYGRLLNHAGDPLHPGKKTPPNYQLRIHFLGLFDTVKSYGWLYDQPIIHNEMENPSVLNVRHAIAIDEKRIFFRQAHWLASKGAQTCKEVWFAGSHSDVGGGYPESDSGLAKIVLEWIVHEALPFGLKLNAKRYGRALQRKRDKGQWTKLPSLIEDGEIRFSAPDPKAKAHESLESAWKVAQLLPAVPKPWEVANNKNMRTIKSEQERLDSDEDHNRLIIHRSVLERIQAPEVKYEPQSLKAAIINLLNRSIGEGTADASSDLLSLIGQIPPENIEDTKPIEEIKDFIP